MFDDFSKIRIIFFYMYLLQWFLTFLKSGNTFDLIWNTKINDPKNEQKHPAQK